MSIEDMVAVFPTEEDRAIAEYIETLPRVVEVLADIARPVWHFGDGGGGAVFQDIARMLADGHGLYASGQMWSPTDRLSRVVSRYGWVCHYCAAPLGVGHPMVSFPNVEHVVPKSRGGSDLIENLVPACEPCNREKGTQTAIEWLGRPCCEEHGA